MANLAQEGGTLACVSGQNWWYLGGYKKLRKWMLDTCSMRIFVALGANAFLTPMYTFNIGLTVFDRLRPSETSEFVGLDVDEGPDPVTKARAMRDADVMLVRQKWQESNPDHRISFSTAHRSVE